MSTFDPDAAARPGAGVFGLPHTRAEAQIVLLPVPYDATTSYGGGASSGAEAIRRASAQVDLLDMQFGAVYECGIYMLEPSREIAELSKAMRLLAAPIIERGGAEGSDADAVAKVDAAGERVNAYVYDQARSILAEGRTPGLVGGDHSTPFGMIRAVAEHVAATGGKDGLGILQIDAHMDLRVAFEGFKWSHASIMHNVLAEIPQVSRIVQVGLRDVGAGEVAASRASHHRVIPHFDMHWARELVKGEKFLTLCEEAIQPLPRDVYVSFDIDGLDPSLCPGTGTPVPGGLSFNQACLLLETLHRSGRRVVGFDLNEVSPDPSGASEWDANVGARVLYKLCGVLKK